MQKYYFVITEDIKKKKDEMKGSCPDILGPLLPGYIGVCLHVLPQILKISTRTIYFEPDQTFVKLIKICTGFSFYS